MSEVSKEAEIQERRAKRKAEAAKAEAEQYAKDLEALDKAEVDHGDGAVSSVRIPFRAGYPVLVIVKAPEKAFLKRYRSRVKIKDGTFDAGANAEAAEELAPSCLVYPEKATFDELCGFYSGLAAQVGSEAIKLASGKAADEGKG